MTAVWQQDSEGWRLLSSVGFPDEATLHDLVEQAPHLLPLSGRPNLTVLGREVLLGGNYADLLAVEPSGRIVVVEIKLAKNSEARRAVIAQVLTYAAFLRGTSVKSLETDVLHKHLHGRGFSTLLEAALADDQEGGIDHDQFSQGVQESLELGQFRLVIVLDSAPQELVRLVGYLEAVSEKLTIDLITVASFDVGGTQIVIPQRVEPDRLASIQESTKKPSSSADGILVEGAKDFLDAISDAPQEQQAFLYRLAGWAEGLENERLVKLFTYHGKNGIKTLLPRLQPEDVGLVTIYNETQYKSAYLQFWRSVMTKHADASLSAVETAAAPAVVGQGTTTRNVSDQLLEALTDAYREAAGARIQVGSSSDQDV